MLDVIADKMNDENYYYLLVKFVYTADTNSFSVFIT